MSHMKNLDIDAQNADPERSPEAARRRQAMNATLPASTAMATITAQQAGMIGEIVSNILDGRNPIGQTGMSVMTRLPFDIRFEDGGDHVLVTPLPAQEIDRPGINAWFKSLELFRSGRIVAHPQVGPWTLDRELSPATAPRLGLMDSGSSGSTLVLAENPIVAKATAAGHDQETVRKALEAAIREVPPTAAGRRRGANKLQRKATRETAIKAGLAANGVPESAWKYAFGLLRIALMFVPYGSVISAIIWAVDAWLGGEGQ